MRGIKQGLVFYQNQNKNLNHYIPSDKDFHGYRMIRKRLRKHFNMKFFELKELVFEKKTILYQVRSKVVRGEVFESIVWS